MFPSEEISIDMSINDAAVKDIKESLEDIRRVRLEAMIKQTPNFRGENWWFYDLINKAYSKYIYKVIKITAKYFYEFILTSLFRFQSTWY